MCVFINYISKAVKTVLKSLQGIQRDIDEVNDGILNSLLNIDPYDIDEQPAIIRHAVADIREEVLDDNGEIKNGATGAYKCRIKNYHRALVQHTNLWKRTLMMLMSTLTDDAHVNVKWTKEKLNKYKCVYCAKCFKIFIVSAGACTHLQPKTIVQIWSYFQYQRQMFPE